MDKAHSGFFGRSRLLIWATLLGLLGLGFGVRLVNLTNPPLDFFAGRQLRSATIARSYFYQWNPSADPILRQLAIQLGSTPEKMEPEILEQLSAFTYLVAGGEHLWIPRLYSILFWMIGGLALFGLARKLTSTEGAMVSLAFYLMLDYAVVASRSFQPDPLMVMSTLLAGYCLYTWIERPSWKWTLAAGVTSGFAILVKAFAIFPVAMMAILLVLVSIGFRRALRDLQVWCVAILMIIFPSAYYLVDRSSWSGGYIQTWVLPYTGLLLHRSLYVGWLNLINNLVPIPFLISGIAGFFLFDRRGKAVAGGLWLGYILLGAAVPELISTHTYYSLPLIPVFALGLSSLGSLLFRRVQALSTHWQIVFAAIALLALLYPAWTERVELLRKNYRFEEFAWKQIGDSLPTDGTLVGLTADDGYRLIYYGWRQITYWPYIDTMQFRSLPQGSADATQAALDQFTKNTQGYTYFMVSNPSSWTDEPPLKALLLAHAKYTMRKDLDYMLFDLRTLK